MSVIGQSHIDHGGVQLGFNPSDPHLKAKRLNDERDLAKHVDPSEDVATDIDSDEPNQAEKFMNLQEFLKRRRRHLRPAKGSALGKYDQTLTAFGADESRGQLLDKWI